MYVNEEYSVATIFPVDVRIIDRLFLVGNRKICKY